MLRIASPDPFVDLSDWTGRQGRPVANEGFLRALLRHAPLEELTLYCPDVAYAERVRARLDAIVGGRAAPVVFRHHLDFADDVRAGRVELVHLSDFTWLYPHVAALRNRVSPRALPVTGITHSLDGPGMEAGYLALAAAGLQPWDAIVCTSTAATRTVRHALDRARLLLGGEGQGPRLPRIPLGVDDEVFAPADAATREARRLHAREALGLPMDKTIVLSVGRLSVRGKADLSPLLELLARLRHGGALETMHVVLAGGSEDEQRLLVTHAIAQLRLESHVTLLPNFDLRLKPVIYAAADVYLSLVDNLQETFGINVVEGMAAGLPCLVSDFDGYRDLVEHEVTGLRVPTTWGSCIPPFLDEARGILDPSVERFLAAQMLANDLEFVRDALLRLHREPALRRALGSAAREAAERYRWERIVGEYVALWEELREAASRTPWPAAAPVVPPLPGDWHGDFAHFPTRLLVPSVRIALTDEGRTLLEGTSPVTPLRYDDVQYAMSPQVERAALEALEYGPLTAEALTRSLGAGERWSRGRVEFQLLWLMKHGLVRVE